MGKWIYGTQNIFMDGKPKRQGCYLIWQKYGIRSAERNPWRQLDEGLSLKEQLAKVVLEVLQWLNSSKTKGISPKAASQLDGQANPIINAIDGSPLLGRYKLCFRFDGIALGVNQLSTGCKTVLNVLYYPDKVFCLKECGNNALEILYHFETGHVFSEYALIPFTMDTIAAQSKSGKKVISDYEELKGWWDSEK